MQKVLKMTRLNTLILNQFLKDKFNIFPEASFSDLLLV